MSKVTIEQVMQLQKQIESKDLEGLQLAEDKRALEAMIEDVKTAGRKVEYDLGVVKAEYDSQKVTIAQLQEKIDALVPKNCNEGID